MATNEIVKATANTELNIFNSDTFSTMQRAAKMFASSAIVPVAYQASKVGMEQATANCFIALQMSQELHINPMTTMQNLYIVQGKPAWSSTFIISCFNTCGRFSPIAYQDNFADEKDRTKWWCLATAKDKAGNVYKGTKVTWQMADSEGWTKKNGSKWLTMPEQMFRYRAATFFIRALAPEILMGFRPIDEIEDIKASEDAAATPIMDAVYTVETAEKQPEPTPNPDAEISKKKREFNECIVRGDFDAAEVMLTEVTNKYPDADFSSWKTYLAQQKSQVVAQTPNHDDNM